MCMEKVYVMQIYMFAVCSKTQKSTNLLRNYLSVGDGERDTFTKIIYNLDRAEK